RPEPDIRIAATSPDTFVTNGKLGYPIFVAVRTGTFAELVPDIETYRAAYKAAGHPGKAQVYLRVPMYVAQTDAAAPSECAARLLAFYKAHAKNLLEAARKIGEKAAIERARGAEALMTMTYDEALGTKLVSGSPAAVIDQLTTIRDALGL